MDHCYETRLTNRSCCYHNNGQYLTRLVFDRAHCARPLGVIAVTFNRFNLASDIVFDFVLRSTLPRQSVWNNNHYYLGGIES